MVDCPACKRSHGKLSPGIYKCPCTAQFRVDKNPDKKNPVEDYRVWPTGKDTWEVREIRQGVEVGQERLLGEVRFKKGRFQAKTKGGEWRIPGWISDGDAFRWVVGQYDNPVKDNPMGRTKPKPKHSPYDRAQRRTRKTARAGSGAPASDGNGAYPSPKMRRDNPKLTGEDRKKAEKYLNQLRSLGSVSMDKDSLAKRLEARLDLYPHEAKSIVFDWYKKIKANPDAPEGFWDFPPVFAYHYTSEGPRYDRPIPEAQRYFEDDEWKPYYASSKRGGNGHIADPFTPRRHFGMFTYKGNRAVELFAQRWRDSFLSEESGSLTERGFIWDGGDKLLSELEQLASLPGMEEARDTDVREQIISYVLEGDKTVEMDGETYHYPHMVTPDYYSD